VGGGGQQAAPAPRFTRRPDDRNKKRIISIIVPCVFCISQTMFFPRVNVELYCH
jgi:hypothetical protein